MRIIQAGRRAGKTSHLVEHVRMGVRRGGWWSRVLVVSDERQANLIRRETGLEEGQVVSSQAWAKRRLGVTPPDSVVIDNIEDWLYAQFGLLPDAVTMTAPVEIQKIALPECVRERIGTIGLDDESGLIEDEDGAPYPEEVQQVAAELRLRIREVDSAMEAMRLELEAVQVKARRDRDGALAMLASVVLPKDGVHGE